MYPTYKRFIFLSAGPVGDHLVQIEMADRFFESTRIPSVIVMKHPNSFLRDLASPYRAQIKLLDFKGFYGVWKMALLAIESIWNRNCYVLVFPIPLPRYLKIFIYYIRFFTRSRIIGFNLEGTKSFPKGKGYASVLGHKNTIPMQAEMFYISANRLLTFLGFKEIPQLPRLQYFPQDKIFEKLEIKDHNYIAMHITPSHILRTLPPDRWGVIISAILQELPQAELVFTGTNNDIPFIHESLQGIPQKRIIIAAGKTNAQELLTLYDKAKVNVTVQTGNGLMINLLHKPAVVVDIKGTAMFYYDFNEKATILYSSVGCRCNPFETECNLISYKGKEYMACLFNLKDEDIVRAIVAKYYEY
jgi:ADP-heptose:LPS heptosyltransferase